MNTFHDFSDLGELLRVLPARLRLVADYVSREDALEREAAAELLDECAARLEAQRDRLARCNADVLHASWWPCPQPGRCAMPNPLEQRVEALERKMADLDAMLESLLACAQRLSDAVDTPESVSTTEVRHD